MSKPHVVIVSPALASANNGNWQTARRWLRFLRRDYRVTLAVQWDGSTCDAMIALHARRSATSIAAFSAAFPSRPLIVALTGTDLYRDILVDVAAQRSLQLATRMVVLQPAGLEMLAPALREKTRVIYQSAPSLVAHRGHPSRYFDVTMIGHLRAEKDPATFMRAAEFVQTKKIRLIHIGGALEPELESLALQTRQRNPQYQWLGSLPHAEARQRLKRSRLMVISSRMEGGANVIIEAVTSGVPVLASDIPGNRGMLGDHYAGYFPAGDSLQLARLIDRAAGDEEFLGLLRAQCADRAPVFAPQRERADVLHLLEHSLNSLTNSGG